MLVSRRSLLIAASVPVLGCGRASAAGQTLHIAPGGRGDGAAWGSAAGLGDLQSLIERAAPGGEIRIAADAGDYELSDPIVLSAGGAAGRPIRVRGVSRASGEAMAVPLKGDRGDGAVGTEAIRLVRGANHLAFSHFSFSNFGNGCFHIAAPVSDLVIEDCAFDNVYRFLENTSLEEEAEANLVQFAVRRCRGVRAERGFLRLRYGSRRGVIEDCAAQGEANEGGSIPAGCALDDSASDIVYRRCIMENFQQWRAGDYWNGDGFSDEPDNRTIRYEACEARGSTDGGFDCKSADVVLVGCVAEDNKRNFRIWDDRATLTGCTSRNPNFRGEAVETADACHVWIGNARARIRLEGLTIEDGDATPILEFDHASGEARVRGLTVHSPNLNWGKVRVRTEGDLTIARPE